MNRVSSANIFSLKSNEIFVYGTNKASRHGKGAAKQALKFGAVWGQQPSEGLVGQTYGIPTKDEKLNVLNLYSIECSVNRFFAFASENKDLCFLVTPIGCGLAGYKPKEIAPFFVDASYLTNVYLPECFWKIINK